MGNAHKKKKRKEHHCVDKCFKKIKQSELKCAWHPSQPFRWQYTEKHHIALKSLISSRAELSGISDDILEIIKSYILNIMLVLKKQEIYYKHIRSNIYHDTNINKNIGKFSLCRNYFKPYEYNECYEARVAVLGASSVGKRQLIVRIVADAFSDEYDPKIEDYYRKMTEIQGLPIMLELRNGHGIEEFEAMIECWIRECELFWLCFDVTRRKTYDRCIELLCKIIRIREDEIKSVLFVGCKNDARYARFEQAYDDSDEMDTFDVMEQIEAIGDFPYIEVSSKQNINAHYLVQMGIFEAWIQNTCNIIDWDNVYDILMQGKRF